MRTAAPLFNRIHHLFTKSHKKIGQHDDVCDCEQDEEKPKETNGERKGFSVFFLAFVIIVVFKQAF